MSKLRKSLLILIPVCLFSWGVYALIFDWMIPRTAAFTMPGKWNRIPFRQSKEIAHAYFGEPVDSSANTEVWRNGVAGKNYSLRLYYGADTTVVAYSVRYSFKNWLVSREYLMDSATVR